MGRSTTHAHTYTQTDTNTHTAMHELIHTRTTRAQAAANIPVAEASAGKS